MNQTGVQSTGSRRHARRKRTFTTWHLTPPVPRNGTALPHPSQGTAPDAALPVECAGTDLATERVETQHMHASRAFLFLMAVVTLASTATAAPIDVPRGTRLVAQLDHDLRSNDIAVGDRFELTVVRPVRIGSHLAIPP